MDFTMEQIQKAMTATSAEELLAMAKEDGIELTLSDAEKYYSQLHENFEMTDDDLQMVAGGKGERIPEDQPKFYLGQRVRFCSILGTIIAMHKGYFNSTTPKAWLYTLQMDNGSVFTDRPLDLMNHVESVD